MHVNTQPQKSVTHFQPPSNAMDRWPSFRQGAKKYDNSGHNEQSDSEFMRLKSGGKRSMHEDVDGGAAGPPRRGRSVGVLAAYSVLLVIGLSTTAWNVCMAMKAAAILGIAERSCRDLRAAGAAGNRCRLPAGELLYEAAEMAKKSAKVAADPGYDNHTGDSVREAQRSIGHLGSSYYAEPPNSRYQPIDRWTTDKRLGSVLQGNVSSYGGGLLINDNGFYFVYSKVGYVLHASDRTQVSPSTDHRLLVKTVGSQKEASVLARAQKTRCWVSTAQCSLSSSYLGAVFHLRKGDLLSVEVDAVKFIWQSRLHTYLGAYSV